MMSLSAPGPLDLTLHPGSKQWLILPVRWEFEEKARLRCCKVRVGPLWFWGYKFLSMTKQQAERQKVFWISPNRK